MSSFNEIFVRRKNKYFIDPSIYPHSTDINNISERQKRIVGTFCKNLETSFGYSLSNSFIGSLLVIDESQVKEIYDNLTRFLHLIVPFRIHKRMYRNFPNQVMELSEAELYTNAVMHYLGDIIGQRIMPDYPEEARPPLLEDTNTKVIDLGNKEEFYRIFYNLMQSNSSISGTDEEDLSFVLNNYLDDYLKYYNLPESFNHKEVMAFVITILLNKRAVVKDYVLSHIDNINDILRIVEGLCDGDLSLNEKTKYKLKRRNRKLVLSLIDELIIYEISSVEQALEDMHRHKMKWIKLGEVIHPGEFKHAFYHAYYLFNVLRNKKIETFNSKVDNYIQNGYVIEAANNVLIKRPGDFSRRILHLLRLLNSNDIGGYNQIIDSFSKVAHKVSTRVLFQLYGEVRALILKQEGYIEKEFRTFLPKGKVSKAFTTPDERDEIPVPVLRYLINNLEDVLVYKFKQLDDLGNVYLDPNLAKYTIPMSQRSASGGIKTIPRFSRFSISENKNIRFFIYWKNKKKERVDIDLSACFLDENLDLVDYIAYTNLRSASLRCCHSGDITSAPHGASEFIDIDLDRLCDKGIRYVVPSIFNFTGDAFYDIPESSFGWMEREDVNSGEIYEPKTVENRIDLSAEMQSAVPLIIDVVDRSIIWCDLTIKVNPGSFGKSQLNSYQIRSLDYGINPSGINIENNLNTVKAMLLGAINSHNRPDLYTLFYLHGCARGEFVDDKDEADVIFSEDNETQYNIDEILADYLV